MKLKKLSCSIAGIAVLTLFTSLSVFATTNTEGAYTEDENGVQIWDLTVENPTETEEYITDGHYTYGEGGLSDKLAGDPGLSEDKLRIYNKDSEANRYYFYNEGFYILYHNNVSIEFVAKNDGIVELELESSNGKAEIYINGNLSASGTYENPYVVSAYCDKGDTISVKGNGNRSIISKVVFTPTNTATYTFDAPLSEMANMKLYVDYTESSTEKKATMEMSELITTKVTGGGDALLAIKFTEVPSTVEITSVTIK